MNTSSFKARKEEALQEDRVPWLPENHPEREAILGIISGLKKWRNEVVELIAEQTGSYRIPLQIDQQIDERLSELKACDIDPEQDSIVDQLRSMRVLVGRQAAMQIIDHPIVQWVLTEKSRRMKELRAQAKNTATPPSSPAGL